MALRRVLLGICFSAAVLSAWLVQVGLQANAAPASDPAGWPTITLTTLTGGLDKPLYVTHAGDGSGRIFIVERPGKIRIYKNGALLPNPFLNITNRVESLSYEERGLLSVAFPPSYTVKGHFYVYYTDHNGDLVIARYGLTGDPDVADSLNETIVLTISHPDNSNHNGGQLQFGPDDGYLYLATGDGGGAGDTPNNAQNHNVLLGKMLRIDVETGNPVTYTVPPSNPYTATAGYRPEIWALGLRNPWRFSFDRLTHDLYIGDVGQALYEEIDLQSAGSQGGENYGWNIREGFHCYNAGTCPELGYTPPIAEYFHNGLQCVAIQGGYVYRGSQWVLPRGIYFYGDHCSGRIWGLRFNGSTWEGAELANAGDGLSSFGEDEAGNLYVANIDNGIVSRIDSVESQLWLPIIVR